MTKRRFNGCVTTTQVQEIEIEVEIEDGAEIDYDAIGQAMAEAAPLHKGDFECEVHDIQEVTDE